MRKTLAMLLAASCIFGLTACGGSGSSDNASGNASGSEAAATGATGDTSTLKVIQTLDPGTFEPGNNDEQSYGRILVQIYDTLTRFDANGELQPWLAES